MAMAAQGVRSPTAKSVDASPKDGSKGKSDIRFRSQFRKTELCAFFMKGWCSKAGRCEFAHGEHELQAVPDLSKTSLCKKWLRHACERSSQECPFAHGARELKVTATFAVDNQRRAKEAREHFAQAAAAADVPEIAPPSPRTPPAATPQPTQTVVSLELAVAFAPPQVPLVCEDSWSPYGTAAVYPQGYQQDCQVYPMGCSMLDLLATSPTMSMAVTYPMPMSMCSTPASKACQELPTFGMDVSPSRSSPDSAGGDPCTRWIAAIASQTSGDIAELLRQAALTQQYED